MKKALLVLSIILFYNSVSANPGLTLPTQHTQHAPNAFERFLNTPITKETLATGAKRLGGAMVANKTRVAIGLGSTLVLAGVGYSAYEIKNDPEKIEYLLESRPNLIPIVEKQFKQYEWGVDYLYNIGVGKEFWKVQEDLEKTQDWKNALQSVKVQIAAEAEKRDNNTSCNNPNYAIKILESLTNLPDDFAVAPETALARQYEINQSGNIIAKNGITFLDVNSYVLLKKYEIVGDNLDVDHIPAKAQIKLYIAQKLGRKLNTWEEQKIEKNATALPVTVDMHFYGRTKGGKNDATQIALDAKNLKLATLKDLANHFLFISNNFGIQSNEMLQFIESSIVLWNRNKSLCLYQ